MRPLVYAAALLLAACPAPPEEDEAPPLTDRTVGALSCAVEAWSPPPACGTGPVVRGALLPGPADPAHDAALASAALRRDRLFHGLFAPYAGVNVEASVPLDATEARAAIDAFVAGEGWDFEAATGLAPLDVVGSWAKVAGAYAGVGIAADAFRYGVLRDEGAPCAEVDAARAQLLRGLDGLHQAVAMTGAPGVIARGYARRDLPGLGAVVETVPLFDGAGAPQPPDKTNGTWRDDASGAYPDFVWEDSCSRDMLVGWAAGFGAAWEVAGRDPSIPEAATARLREDAAAILASLLTVQDSGYDLEIRDADGRMTYHGILHERSVDRVYVPTGNNGFNAMMSLGIAAALSLAAGDADLDAELQARLVEERALAAFAAEWVSLIDFGLASNYSNHNMAFLGGLLAQRYLCDPDARADIAAGMDEGLYEIPGRTRQPAEQSQGLYHLAGLVARAGGSAWEPAAAAPDPVVYDRLLTSLRDAPAAPLWDTPVVNCDDAEIAAGVCETVAGRTVSLPDGLGRNDVLVSTEPLSLTERPPSNYYWRSNPYQLNGGGDGTGLYSGVDVRLVTWWARWIRR